MKKQNVWREAEGVRGAYVSPSVREREMALEAAFLQSNTEPIGGGDDPDIEW